MNSHAPTPQKQETLENLIQRLISIFSDYKLLEDELNYLRNVFIKINAYPPKLVNNIIKIELEKKNSSDEEEVTTNAASKLIELVLVVPYTDKRGNDIKRKMNGELHKHLQDDVKVMITYQGTKLSSRFKSKIKQNLNIGMLVVYCCKCPENDCDDFYIRKTDRQISE